MAPYSAKHPAFESENSEVERAVQIITHGIGTKGVWVGDRGFDNRWFFNTMERFGLRFLVCAYHARTVLWHGQECSLSDVVNEVSFYRKECQEKNILRYEQRFRSFFDIESHFRSVLVMS
jgi:hypothetical protein